MNKFIKYAICILLLIQTISGIGMITPTKYPRVSVLSEGQKAVFTFYFKVDTSIKANSYIKIQLSNFPSLTTERCVISLNSINTWQDTECSNIPAQPNILYVKVPQDLSNENEENALQIDLEENNPISQQSDSIQIWTVDKKHQTEFFVYDLNLNFGSIPFKPPVHENLQATLLSYGTPETESKPSGINVLRFSVQVNEQIGDEDLQAARLKIVITSPWQILSDGEVTAEQDPRFVILNPLGDEEKKQFLDADLYKQPVIDNFVIESPNQLSIVFKEYFKPGRSFIIQLTQIQNSPKRATGSIKLYTMNYNSNIVLEQNENLMTLEISYNKIQTDLIPPVNIPYTGPIGFFKNQMQFVTVKFSTDTDVPENQNIIISFNNGSSNVASRNNVIQGTAYASPNIPTLAGKEIKFSYSFSSVTITNIGALPKDTDYFLTVRLRISSSEANLECQIDIDEQTSPAAGTALFQGKSQLVPLKTNVKSIVNRIGHDSSVGASNIILKRTAAGTSTINIQTTTDIPSLETGNTSFLEMYTNAAMTSSSVACALTQVVGGVSIPTDICEITTVANEYTKIKIGHSTGNAFPPSTAINVLISNLDFDGAHNYQDRIYEFTFRFYKSSQPDSQFIDFILTPRVQPEAIQTDFDYVLQSHVNQQTQSSNYNFPTLINFVAKTSTSFNYPKAANEVRTITIWAYQGFQGLVAPVSSESFPCGSNLSGVTCSYIEGNQNLGAVGQRRDTTFSGDFMELDHINIFLPDDASTSGFHVIVPEKFALEYYSVETPPTSGTYVDFPYYYEYYVQLGLYNTETRAYRYEYKQTDVLNFNPGDYISNQAGITTRELSITLAGYAGSKINNVQLKASSTGSFTMAGNTASDFGAALVLVTDWEIWVQGSSEYDQATPNQLSSSPENAPITFMFWDRLYNPVQHFVTVFPLVFAGSQALNVDVRLNNILLPFSYDLPNHNFYVTDNTGDFQIFQQYYNSGPNWFYQAILPSLDIVCTDQAKGIVNTYCEITFQTNINIQPRGKIYIDFVGIEVYTDSCVFQHEHLSDTNDKVVLSNSVCSVNIQSDQMIIELNEDNLLETDRRYRIAFYGAEFKNDQSILQRYIDVSTRDNSGRFVIEGQQKQVPTTLYEPQYITVTEISYDEINSYVFSSLKIYFTTPRNLYPNENIALDMGTDLNDVNTNTDRLSVRLFRVSNGEEINIAVNFELQKMKVLFEDRSQFTADSYRIDIHNIRNPASNDNDYFKILFIRDFDDSQVLSNIQSTTSPFPAFLDRTVSDISLHEARYLQEGALQELIFKIRMQDSKVDSRTRIIISFPIYYCPSITNFEHLMSCRINDISIQCVKDSSSPYRLIVSNSPINLHAGEQFTLKVFGVITPQKALRDLPSYNQETLFVGVNSGNPDENYYKEFVHLPPPAVTLGLNTNYLYIQHIDIPNKYSGSLSDHTIKLYTDGIIPADTGLLIVFPVEYSTLIITNILQCNVRFEDGSYTEKIGCPVEGRAIKISVGPDPISERSYFYVQIFDMPTPPFDGEVDFNDTIIQAYNPTNYEIETRNFYLTNRMQNVSFQKLNNVLKINDAQVIQVVKGTYSKEIFIKTPESDRYITNLQLDAEAEGFEFQPKTMQVYLGDFETKFRIGAHKNLQEKPYQFSINMEEKYFKKYYSIANTYVIFLTTNPVQIDIPQTFTVPIGGCSLPYKLALDNTPQDELEVSVQYNYEQYPEKVFFLDLELSSYVLQYSKDITYRYISFCITSDYSHPGARRILQGSPPTSSTMKASLHLGGYNSPAYSLRYSDIDLNIITKTEVEPSLQLQSNTVKRTEFVGDVVIPTDGVLYWHLYVKDSAQDLSLSQIKFFVKYQNLILQSSTDNQDNVLGIKKDERVGLEVYQLAVTPHQITLRDLQPETDYKLCGFFENEFKNATPEQTCVEFRTSEWDLFTKVTIQFTKNTYEDMMNDILCFYVRQVKTRIFNIISTSGVSCSFGVSPDFYYYKYKGKTYSKDEHATNIYLIPDLKIETDIALQTLRDFYDTANDDLNASIITTAQDDHQIDFIRSGKYIQKFQYSQATNAQGDFTIPKVTKIEFKAEVTRTEASVHAVDITLDKDGVVYFILDRIYKLEYDPFQEALQEFPINVVKNPTPEQIIDCKNSFGTPAQRCHRAVITNGQKVETIFEDLLFESGYVVYYVLANEYPLRPIFGKEVYSEQIHVGSRLNDSSSYLLGSNSSLLLILLIVLSLFM